MAAASDFEESFIASLLDRRGRQGANFSMSAREREIVMKIAGEE